MTQKGANYVRMCIEKTKQLPQNVLSGCIFNQLYLIYGTMSGNYAQRTASERQSLPAAQGERRHHGSLFLFCFENPGESRARQSPRECRDVWIGICGRDLRGGKEPAAAAAEALCHPPCKARCTTGKQIARDGCPRQRSVWEITAAFG